MNTSDSRTECHDVTHIHLQRLQDGLDDFGGWILTAAIWIVTAADPVQSGQRYIRLCGQLFERHVDLVQE